MFILRFIVLIVGLFLLGLGIAFAVTRDSRYLRHAWLTIRVVVVLLVAFGVPYVFERVPLIG